MDYNKELTNYIKIEGAETVAAALGKKASTVKTWVKTQNFPSTLLALYLESKSGDTAQPVDETPSAPIKTTVTPMPTDSARIESIEKHLVKLGQYLDMIAPKQPGRPRAPITTWAEVDENDKGFSSDVRPESSAISKGTFGAPRSNAPSPTASSNAPGLPAAVWLKPKPLAKENT